MVSGRSVGRSVVGVLTVAGFDKTKKPSKCLEAIQVFFFLLHVFIIDIQVSIKSTDKNTALKEIGCLTKALQDTDLSGNILKEDADYFADLFVLRLMT